MTKYAAIDTETVYTKDYTVTELGNECYVLDPRFECYLVTIKTEELEFVGLPKDAPWDKIADHEWVFWNAGFDRAVLKRLVELGIIPDVKPPQWHCASNLARYCHFPRALADATKVRYGIEMKKTIRNRDMKGKTAAQLQENTELWKAILEYAIEDARHTYRFWMDHHDQWPEHERWLSRHTYEMGAYGIYLDRPNVEQAIELMKRVVFENQAKLPWYPAHPALSPKQLGIACREAGIEPPSSLAQDDELCILWEDTYSAKFPWVAAMRNIRKANSVAKKCQAMLRRVRPDGRMSFSLYYFGADTGRWSGAGGVNLQNLQRSPYYIDDQWNFTETKTEKIVNLRSFLIAAPGFKFGVSDLGQIEPRCISILSGNRKFLSLVRSGINPYEAHARATMGWVGGDLKKESPITYLLSKARLISLSYSAGYRKFIDMARIYVGDEFEKIFAVKPTDEQYNSYISYARKYDVGYSDAMWETLSEKERWILIQSWVQVTDYRRSNPELSDRERGLWARLQKGAISSAGGTFAVELPSGRALRYFEVSVTLDGVIRARFVQGGYHEHIYGGLLAENITQAMARDVFAAAIRRLEDAGFRVVLHIHDEVVLEIPESVDAQEAVLRLMTLSPSWAPQLPVGASYEETKCYLK